MTDPPTSQNTGMTLVEVLLAIVILGVSLIALVDGASQALSVVRQARNYEMARRMLGQVEAESPLRLMDEISAGQESGAFQSGPSGWTWAREIVDVSEGDEDDQRAGLFLVTTRVSWSHGRRSGSEEVTQYLYVPEDSDGTRTLKPRTL